MTKRIMFIVICLQIWMQPVWSQDQAGESDVSFRKAEEIIAKARIAIDPKNIISGIKSIKLIKSGESYTNMRAEIEGKPPIVNENRGKEKTEILFSTSGSVKTINEIRMGDPSLNTEVRVTSVVTVRGDQVSIKTDGTIDGQKIDLGKSDEIMALVGKQLGIKEMGKITAVSGSQLFSYSTAEFFPFLLRQLNSNPWRFNYVGAALADGITANVLEYIPESSLNEENKSITRYFFESTSNRLLLVTQDSKNRLGTTTINTYYSAHKLIGGIVIPTRIKLEQQTILDQKSSVLGITIISSKSDKITELTIDEFEINSKIPPATFETKYE